MEANKRLVSDESKRKEIRRAIQVLKSLISRENNDTILFMSLADGVPATIHCLPRACVEHRGVLVPKASSSRRKE
jgi:hypothetical protein